MSNGTRRLFRNEHKKYWYAAAGVVLLLVIAVVIVAHMPTKIPPLTMVFPKDGNHFTISSGATTGPRLEEGYLIPLHPVPGDTQTLSIIVSDSSTTITSVIVTMVTAETSTMHMLKLAEGNDTNGLWKGSWRVSDTDDNVYNVIIAAADGATTSSVTITLP